MTGPIKLIKPLSARERIYRIGGQNEDPEDSFIKHADCFVGSAKFCIYIDKETYKGMLLIDTMLFKKQILAYSDLLPNISPVGGQS